MGTSHREIGRIGTAGRVLVGIGFLELGIVGVPPVRSLLPWWQVATALLVLPAIAGLIQVAWFAYRHEPMRELGTRAALINCAVVTFLLLVPLTRGMALVYLGSGMLLAAIRGYAGCETLAISNWLLRRDDQVGCVLFTPLDRLEMDPLHQVGHRRRLD